MNTPEILIFLSLCLEGFLYGIYTGIFALYLQCHTSNNSRTANIIFYVICLLYIFTSVSVVCDSLNIILESIFSGLSPQLQIDSQPMLKWIRVVHIVQMIVDSCIDFTSQCIIIYRCWIVWGQNIRVVIIPSILAITHLVTWLSLIAPGTPTIMFLVGLAASMAVNTLVTGMIVFRILKVMGIIKPTSVERSLGSTEGTKFRHILLVIIESAMALFTIQLVRVVVEFIPVPASKKHQSSFIIAAYDFVIAINQILNGIVPTIILVRVQMRLSFDDEESFKEAAESLRFNNPPSDPNTTPQQMGSSGRMSLQDSERIRNEDGIIQSDPNTLRRLGSSSSIQEIGSGDMQF